jgi:tRNA/tmRNA/rRNA uracil-C5-methylase (TrmA/RlmC/RlmD family)
VDEARVGHVSLTGPQDGVVDVGAGAGRFVIPLARRVRQIVAVEPSEAMRTALARDVQPAGLTNVQVVPQRWDEVSHVRACSNRRFASPSVRICGDRARLSGMSVFEGLY